MTVLTSHWLSICAMAFISFIVCNLGSAVVLDMSPIQKDLIATDIALKDRELTSEHSETLLRNTSIYYSYYNLQSVSFDHQHNNSSAMYLRSSSARRTTSILSSSFLHHYHVQYQFFDLLCVKSMAAEDCTCYKGLLTESKGPCHPFNGHLEPKAETSVSATYSYLGPFRNETQIQWLADVIYSSIGWQATCKRMLWHHIIPCMVMKSCMHCVCQFKSMRYSEYSEISKLKISLEESAFCILHTMLTKSTHWNIVHHCSHWTTYNHCP